MGEQQGKLTVVLFHITLDDAKRKIVVFSPRKMGIGFTDSQITDILPKSQAAKAGVQCGWIILTVNGQKAKSTERIKEIIDKAQITNLAIEILFQKPEVKLECDNSNKEKKSKKS